MAKLQLFYPMSDILVTQSFGENGEYYRAHGINIKGHNGLDLLAYHGKPVYASHDGTAYYEVDDSQGHGVVIVSDKPYDFNGKDVFWKTIYWHLCDPKETKFASPVYLFSGGQNNNKGMPVKAGDLIGYADNTGLSTGDHLHYGFKPIKAGKGILVGDGADVGIGDWVNILDGNGYSGAVDPSPYFNGQYATNAKAYIENLNKQVTALSSIVALLTKLWNNRKK